MCGRKMMLPQREHRLLKKKTPQCQPCVGIMVMLVIEVPEASKAIQAIVITLVVHHSEIARSYCMRLE